MTLIVPFVSQEFVALASDRRITWQIGGASAGWEDTENKAIVLAGHFLMGYTGFARLEGVKTEQWVVEKLLAHDPNSYFSVLATETQAVVDAMTVPLERKGHAFVAVGYCHSDRSALPRAARTPSPAQVRPTRTGTSSKPPHRRG